MKITSIKKIYNHKPSRFSHLTSVAPNANISVICGNTSPSIEPYNANAFRQNTMSGSFLIKNKELDRLLIEEYNLKNVFSGDDYEAVWSSIITNEGSVQHLKFLSDLHKDIFKTALELNQEWIVEHASQRQEFICQGQSVNLFIPSDVHKNELHRLHFSAWKKGLKALYYLRSTPSRKVDTISNNELDVEVTDFNNKYESCLACEG